MKKVFLTFFPFGENEHLAKDIGVIPNIMAKNFGYESYLAVYDREQKFDYLNSVVKDLKIWKIKSPLKPKFGKLSLQSILFFVKNARKIDVVNFYHLTKETKILAIIYKLFNRKGFVYIKADTDIYQKFERHKITGIRSCINSLYEYYFRKITNLISTEQEQSICILKTHFTELKDKIIRIPNGIDFELLKNLGFEHLQKSDKEKLIITVGRIGLTPKNNQMMLEALNGLDLKDWKFALIGPIYDETNIKFDIEQFYLNNPDLRDKVIFTEGIYDKKELYSWYKKASVFCLTSECESWCLAMSDAIYFGCEIVSTNVGCLEDITSNGNFGYKIEKANDLRILLEKIVNGQINVLQNFEKIIERSKEFNWNEICEKLYLEISKISPSSI
ncbi:MAG: glycosyltransferase [Fibromonadaceae bacterium]|jgi:glycosyltransferase involved in cell wall biosynthesis|nr:glycosyltransferase [Fibromonadaceae bacterium]